ncbi:hypothetical protein Taro_041769, partial [Colocasia esculenta]|nr:hypothetical protein [Colocasia esculenta]
MAEEISTPQSQSDNIEIEAESNTQVSSHATNTTSCHPEHAKKRKLRSTVWNDFDRILKEDDWDFTFEITCKSLYSLQKKKHETRFCRIDSFESWEYK